MLSLDDQRWTSLESGYRVRSDIRPLLRQLEHGEDRQAAWAALWEELFHQGDVGTSSYAAVPHLVRIHRDRGEGDWNTYALVASIELARVKGHNPDVPAWERESYSTAIQELAELGLRELPSAESPEAVRSILGILAIVYHARAHARALIEMSEDEVMEALEGSA